MSINITALFVCIDDFCKMYKEATSANLLPPPKIRTRECLLSLSEMLFIEVLYHFSGFKTFKGFYTYGVLGHYRSCFKDVPSYERFVILKERLFIPMTILLHHFMGEQTGIYYADSTPIKVCHNKRINRHKVFNGLAARGKSSMGWFFGFKLHAIINEKGQLIAVKITKGDVDDRVALREIKGNLKGKIFGDKGYIGKQIFDELYKQGLKLITGIRKNMKNYLIEPIDKLLLRKRSIVETSFGLLKETFNLEHSRHRKPVNAFLSMLAALVAYQFKQHKPKIKNIFIPNNIIMLPV